MILESQILSISLFAFLQDVASLNFTAIGVIFVLLIGFIIAVMLYFSIDKRETDIKSMLTDIKTFKNIF